MSAGCIQHLKLKIQNFSCVAAELFRYSAHTNQNFVLILGALFLVLCALLHLDEII